MMRTWVVAMLVGACGGGSKPAPAEPQVVENKQPETAPAAAPQPQSENERVMIAMRRFTDEMCACGPGNAKCAQDVSDRMTTWAQEQAQTNDKPPPISEAEQKAFTEIGMRMGECMQSSLGGGTTP